MLDFPLDESLRYLGAGGRTPPEKMMDDLRRVAALVSETARPRTVWREVPAGEVSFTGITVSALLYGCEKAVLFAATLGAEFDALLMRLQKTDISAAVMADACGSAAIEAVCDGLCGELSEKYAPQGLFTTARISPGYGDFPLEAQDKFCAMLDTQRKIGLAVTGGWLLTPLKSVTALLGLSAEAQTPRRRDCGSCVSRESCKFRKDGTSCDRP